MSSQTSIVRILEIGDHHFCADVYPERTTLLWTGWRPPFKRDQLVYQDCTPLRFLSAMRDVRAGKYDLVVAYAGLYSPWHPRNWLRAFAREPWKPIATLTRGFGVSWLRYSRIRVPFVVLDMNDASLIGRHNFFLLDKAPFVFKRELPADRWHAIVGSAHTYLPTVRIRRKRFWQERLQKIHPIALPIRRVNVDNLYEGDFPDKTADIFFSGEVEANSWARRSGIAELKSLAAHGINVDIADQRLPRAEFHCRMAKAWLAWSPAGMSWECFRTGEAAQCLTVPLVNYPTVERHMPLLDGEHAFYYGVEPGGLKRAVEIALADKGKLKRMAIAAREHVLTHHTPRAIVDHVIETVLTRGK
ncbi:MAG TPA: glycosyltransferase [Xanthobacteraceae bacterium]